MKNTPLIIGNWKSYIDSPKTAKEFIQKLKRQGPLLADAQIVIAPSMPLLPFVRDAIKLAPIELGAQTISAYEAGAHTGDTPASLLSELGVSSVVIGHSERREAGESDEVVRAQVARAAGAGLRAVVCIGEKERDAAGSHFEFLSKQLVSALADLPKTSTPKIVIAYEPVWAIGKSSADAMQPLDLRETSIYIKKILADLFGRNTALRVPIIYGGSVDGGNAGALISEGKVSGLLVGRASASIDPFIEIIKSCKNTL